MLSMGFFKNRVRAFLLHLLISAVIAATVMVVVFWVWYPAPLHEVVGVTEIFLLLLAVDVSIGPLITLIVYKPGKPSLKFDLTVIAILQLCALGYGVQTVFAGRPAFIVFAQDRFELARALDLDPASVDKAIAAGNSEGIAGWTRPKWVGAVESKDPKRNAEILFSAMQGGPDWALLPELYVPLAQVKAKILSGARPLEELRGYYGKGEMVADWRDKHVKWLPLRGKAKNMVVLVDAATAEVRAIIDIDPWKSVGG